ncbi:hypothetical protein Tco_1046193 [Tanacetum coccineum]
MATLTSCSFTNTLNLGFRLGQLRPNRINSTNRLRVYDNRNELCRKSGFNLFRRRNLGLDSDFNGGFECCSSGSDGGGGGGGGEESEGSNESNLATVSNEAAPGRIG